MHSHHYRYKSVLAPERSYWIELPAGASPSVFRTMTLNMRCYHGEVIEMSLTRATALTTYGALEGLAVGEIETRAPCYVVEHLDLDGRLEYWISEKNILQGNDNFVNFGIPGGKHLRIDIYNGNFRVIE